MNDLIEFIDLLEEYTNKHGYNEQMFKDLKLAVKNELHDLPTGYQKPKKLD